MSSRILLWSITAALAGFLVGFDTVVISGAEQKIKSVWHLSAGMHGIAVASALSFGYIISLSFMSWAFFSGHFSIVPTCIFAFIAAHAIGQGAVIWVFISEIFPNRQRAEGQALGSFTHWTFAALLTSLFPKMVSAFAPGYVFAFFACMMVLQLVWVKTMVIETKGVSLERIHERLRAA